MYCHYDNIVVMATARTDVEKITREVRHLFQVLKMLADEVHLSLIHIPSPRDS